VKSGWRTVTFDEAVEDASGGNVKTPLGEYLGEGALPIVDQGERLIGGYSNEPDSACRSPLPVIIFGDHTRRLKYVDFSFGVGADGVKVLRPREGVDAKYLYHYLRSISIPAAGYDRHFKYLKRVSVTFPGLTEQRRIAEVLDRAETLRAQRRQALAQLDALAESIFLDMFGDPLANSKAWPSSKLSALGTLDRGISKHRPRNDPSLLGGAHPLIQTGDVANCDRYIRRFTSTYSEAGLRQSRKWPAGTLCITIAANIAKTGVLTFDACFPDSVVGFTPNGLATTEYIQTWLSFLQEMLEDSAPESAQKNINLAILRELDAPLPPIELQRTHAKRLAAIEQSKAEQRQSLAQFDALFASLQHRAFRGEL
jgi:type I restriction enzyme, S subunit